MAQQTGETWRFEVQCADAQRIYLVRESDDGPSAWIEMQRTGGGQWAVTHHLAPGSYRFRYFRNDGATYLNCGNYGLLAQRIGGTDHHVQIDALEMAASA